MNRIEIETERLLLRCWQPESDLQPYSEMCADPEVMRWIGDGSTQTPDQCRETIAAFEAMWDENGFGLFAVEYEGELLGFAGLAIPSFLPEILPSVEIGWRLKRSAWGHGYATEAAQAALEFGFHQCVLKRIVSICQIGNEASERIMRKLGMTFERETTDPSCNRPVKVYETISD